MHRRISTKRAFNRKLFMARRRAEIARETADPVFYLPSLSANTIVYKGMVMPSHLVEFFPDLGDERVEASVAVFHQRFSTNTLPQWKLAHPFRYLAHNGEINTIEANRCWAVARGPIMNSPLLPDLKDDPAARVDAWLGFAEPRQHARGATDGWPRPDDRDAPADAARLAERRWHRSGPARVLRVLCAAPGTLGWPGRRGADRWPLCLLRARSQWPAAGALCDHEAIGI